MTALPSVATVAIMINFFFMSLSSHQNQNRRNNAFHSTLVAMRSAWAHSRFSGLWFTVLP
jgi:hypothetical protein